MGPPPPLAVPKGGLLRMMSALGQAAAGAAQRVAQVHHAFVVAFHAVQQAVHQRQAAGAGHQFHAQEGLVALELALLLARS